jgi:TPR repeat protein
LRYENDKRFKKGALVQCCLKKAADLQLRIACYDYAKRLLDGDEVPADLPLAQYYAGLAADKGYSPAFALLSRCAQKQGNEESRLAFLKKGIDANDGECCALYGEILENQNDFAGAEAYYKKAYGHLDPEGTYDYARTFIGTSFGHIDKKEAERIYLEACDLGSAKACEDLGRHYLNGVFGENRLEDAKTIFDKGFGQSGSVICLYEICRIEAFLSKVPGDYGFAEDGFKTLLEDCHYAKAAGCLGDMALNENIQRKDCHRALAFYLAGARLKDAYSALRVGEMLRVGEGVKANPTKAVEYFILAGDCGDPDGYDDAAEMYEKGQKIPMDKSKAKELRDKSAILKSKQK